VATASLHATRITPEQFLDLPDRDRYELMKGELVEMPVMSLEGSAIGSRLISLLQAHADANEAGIVLTSEATYQCFPDDPARIRRPDVSFIRAGRLPVEQYEQGHCRIPPDLAVEIVSPNDVMFDLEEKIQEYLAAGVELVWMISPKSRSVTAYRPHGRREAFELGDVVTGESVLPGLQFHVSELFPKLQSAT
jgi:Uma2 family endonuclease